MSATPPQSATLTRETSVSFSAELVTDPVGVTLEATPPTQLPEDAQKALLENVKRRLVGQQNNLIFQSVRVAHGTLRSYGARNDYDIGPIMETATIVETDLTPRRFHVRWGWRHEAAKYFQFGVAPHTIDGTPILSFIWEDAPQEVRERFPNTERVGGDPRVFLGSVDHPGIPAARFVQAGLNWLRREVA